MSPARACAAALSLAALAACRGRHAVPMSGFVDGPVAQVASPVAGVLASVSVREGDLVRKGQRLAQLDARDRAAAVEQAEANLSRLEEVVNQAQQSLSAALPDVKGAGADISRAQAAMDEAQREFDRTERLMAGGSATAAQVDAARSRLLQARAQLQSGGAGRESARGRVRVAMAAVGDARAQLRVGEAALDLARVQLSEAQIEAPFDGRVVNLNLQPGEWVAPGTPVVTLEETARPWVRLDVDETALRATTLGQPAEIRVIAFPDRTYRGRVMEIGALGEFAVNRDVKRGRPDIRTFRVRVAFDQPGPELRPGMTAEVRLGVPEPPRPVARRGERR
jgi:multidrug resistance efflux pump